MLQPEIVRVCLVLPILLGLSRAEDGAAPGGGLCLLHSRVTLRIRRALRHRK